jgi:hypothetical protein
MYVRTSTRRNQDGSKVSYLQLAHNEWDPVLQQHIELIVPVGLVDQVVAGVVE